MRNWLSSCSLIRNKLQGNSSFQTNYNPKSFLMASTFAFASAVAAG